MIARWINFSDESSSTWVVFQCPPRRFSDLSAPFAYLLQDVGRDFLTSFIQPGATASRVGLFMIESYQRGKIPIVLIHGLLSDPFTWGNIANEIRARP